MYSFNARRDTELTCRHWLSDPEGCNDRQCSYAHTITGAMAPPSMFACYAYNNGGCRLSEDACVFSHVISDPGSQYLQIRHPDLLVSDVPIAEAAANAGFDCCDWPKLKGLIDAVRAVNAAVSYPDRWNGPAAFQSSIYPDHWSAAHDARQKASRLQAYSDVGRVPAVPAFVVNAAQILRNINKLPRVRGTGGAPAMRATGSNRIPLGPISGNKRGGDDAMDILSSSPKRLKSERPRQSSIIDLTGDDQPVNYIPTTCIRPQQASKRTAGRGLSRNQRKPRQRAIKDRMSPQSVGILSQIASKLRASAHALEMDREHLRQQWEVDEYLQLRSVTNELAELNEYFGKAEDDIKDALDVIEKGLL